MFLTVHAHLSNYPVIIHNQFTQRLAKLFKRSAAGDAVIRSVDGEKRFPYCESRTWRIYSCGCACDPGGACGFHWGKVHTSSFLPMLIWLTVSWSTQFCVVNIWYRSAHDALTLWYFWCFFPLATDLWALAADYIFDCSGTHTRAHTHLVIHLRTKVNCVALFMHCWLILILVGL